MVTESALLNHPFGADGHIGIERRFHLFGPSGLIPVKIFHLVGTGIGTVTAPNAARIDLGHQAFGVLVGRARGAHLDTRGIVAMLAKHGDVSDLHLRVFALDHGHEFDPGDSSPVLRLFGGRDRHVVLLFTGYHTALTARAPIQIYHHTPTRHLYYLQISNFEFRNAKFTFMLYKSS